MSSSSEGRPFAVVVVAAAAAAVVIVVAAAAADAARLRSFPSLTATLLHGVAEPDERPLVLFPVVGTLSIENDPPTVEGDGVSLFFEALAKKWRRSFCSLSPPAAGSRAGRGHASRAPRAREEERGPFARCWSRIEGVAGPAAGLKRIIFFD